MEAVDIGVADAEQFAGDEAGAAEQDDHRQGHDEGRRDDRQQRDAVHERLARHGGARCGKGEQESCGRGDDGRRGAEQQRVGERGPHERLGQRINQSAEVETMLCDDSLLQDGEDRQCGEDQHRERD
ncbi:hypothetical protein D3C87_1550810 [compost metagenome]